jgi:hypothetical protein
MLWLWLSSLEGQGRQRLGESARACFRLMVLISAFSEACCAHVVGCWMCALQHMRDHLA